MGIQRWDWVDQRVRKDDGGRFVKHADHEQVVADLEQRVIVAEDFCVERDREITRLRAELAAKSKDAERWQYARKLLTVEDILQRQVELSAWNYLVSEVECDRADTAIDQAMGEGNGR